MAGNRSKHNKKNRSAKKSQNRAARTRRMVFGTIVAALLIVMAVQLGRLYQKKQAYAAEEKVYEQQLQDEKDRQKELEDYESYTQSDEYTENEAKSKLGMVHENEIIFREE